MHACIYIHVRLATPTNGSPMPARRTHAPACCVRARARARVRSGAHASAPTHASAFPSAVDRGWLGAQAFRSASAFNANIGAWNTARVTSLDMVCAALSGPGGAPPQAGRARRVFDAARAVVRGGAADARSHVCAQTCGHAHVRAPTCGGIAARTKSISICMHYTYICR